MSQWCKRCEKSGIKRTRCGGCMNHPWLNREQLTGIRDNASTHKREDSTGQTFFLIERDTGWVISTHGSREAALCTQAQMIDPGRYSVTPNPNR